MLLIAAFQRFYWCVLVFFWTISSPCDVLNLIFQSWVMMKATSEKPSKKPRLMDNSRELANIISHDDYGFAPIKKEILRHENATTIRNITSRWKAMESKAKEMKQV